MGLYWPIRWILSWACRSTAGFHQGSIKKTCNEKHEKPVMDQDYQRSDKKRMKWKKSVVGEKHGADIKRGNMLHGDGSDGYFIKIRERERELRL